MEAALAVAMHTEKYRADNPQPPQASSGGKRPVGHAVGAPSGKRRKASKDGFERKSYADIKKEEEAEGFLSEESDQDDKVVEEVEVEVCGATTESVDVDNWAQCDSCNKWRRVPAAAFPLPARWFCKMNPARCTASGGGQWSCAVPEALEEEEDHVVETVAADGCYVVERLLAKRRHHSEVQYLVRWAGFTEASDTWEPAANIGEKMVESFDQGPTMSPPRFSAGPGLSQQAATAAVVREVEERVVARAVGAMVEATAAVGLAAARAAAVRVVVRAVAVKGAAAREAEVRAVARAAGETEAARAAAATAAAREAVD